MLSRYDGKRIRLTTVDGAVFVGKAEVFSPGEGLETFGVEEENVLVRGVHVFLSQIAKIDLLPGPDAVSPEELEALVEELLEAPYFVADILPERVPKDSEGQYFAVEKYFCAPERLADIYRRHAEVMLRFNCCHSMFVTFDWGETWERDPEPEGFVRRVTELAGGGAGFMRAVFPGPKLMIELDAGDTWTSVCCRGGEAPETLRALVSSAGLFLWPGEN